MKRTAPMIIAAFLCLIGIALNAQDIPETAEDFLSRGLEHAEKLDYDNAVADFSGAIRLDPGVAAAYVNSGTVYVLMGSIDNAVADFGEAIQLDHNLAEGILTEILCMQEREA